LKIFGEEHLDDVARLEEECFSLPWTYDGLRVELSNKFARFFVAQAGDEIVGYIGAHNVLGEVSVANIAVSPKYRRQGVGRILLDKLIADSKEEKAEFVTLEVRKTNFGAISLYEKAGFSVVGERKRFYENPVEDALLMTYYFENRKEKDL
jgi:ribosomal-protein-alanine N-acetyltransferase